MKIIADGGSYNPIIDEIPDECPICHIKIQPLIHYAKTYTYVEDIDTLQVVFECTNSKCRNLFIALYENIGGSEYNLVKVLGPIIPEKKIFSNEINDLSSTFVEIYNQALFAEAYDLNELTGIGLRKALEFLVKDFAIKEFPDNEEKIRVMSLGACIKDYIKDENVKECAKRAVWLGNDETHYTRKWEQHDISDLKILIKLTVNGIENVLLSKKYVDEMK